MDTVNEEMLQWLKKAGCQGIHYGIESGSEKILKVLQKGITINQALKIFNLTRTYQIQTLAYFMIGNPGETIDDIKTSFRVMKQLNPDFVHLTILTPFPGTKIYHTGIENGIIKKDYWLDFAKHPNIDFVPPHWGEYFSREELNQLLKKGYFGFYIRPTYILKRLLKIKNKNEFLKKAKAGLKVMFMK